MKLFHLENIILQTKKLIESDKRAEIRLSANGGNSVLIICEPLEEHLYIERIKELLNEDAYTIIDLNQLLLEFVDSNRKHIEELFQLLKGSVKQIFKAPEGEEGEDLFKSIMSKIQKSFDRQKVPVLINSGSLYGSGIDNIHIMEHPMVMKSNIPLIILYPATKDRENFLFLSKRQASKYRCMIVNE